MKIVKSTEGNNITIINSEYYTVYINSGYNKFTQVDSIGYAYEPKKFKRKKIIEPNKNIHKINSHKLDPNKIKKLKNYLNPN
jgi:hypothetical protein